MPNLECKGRIILLFVCLLKQKTADNDRSSLFLAYRFSTN